MELISMFTDKELSRLWSNDSKRRAFIEDYKKWGVWLEVPELDLTFYKLDLPGGDRLIAMEYIREPYLHERQSGKRGLTTERKFYFQHGKYFSPSTASVHEIAGKLKDLKAMLGTGLYRKGASA
jgi:hypothetical protein